MLLWCNDGLMGQTVAFTFWRCRHYKLLAGWTTSLSWRRGASFSLSVHSCFEAEYCTPSLVVVNLFMAGFGYVALRAVFL